MEAWLSGLVVISRRSTGDGDVTMFFFFFENVVMRGKDDGEKALELLPSGWSRFRVPY